MIDLNVGILVGKTLTKAEMKGDEELWFTTVDGEQFRLFHAQDCCESVVIESFVGDLSDLVGEPILIAEQAQGETLSDHTFAYEPESYTWTFYKFATRKGYVDVRWLGESNGYYSESVDFERVVQ